MLGHCVPLIVEVVDKGTDRGSRVLGQSLYDRVKCDLGTHVFLTKYRNQKSTFRLERLMNEAHAQTIFNDCNQAQ